MAERKRFHSMTFKLMAAVCFAFALAVLTFLASFLVGGKVVDHFFLSSSAMDTRLGKEIQSFREYVSSNQIASTDVNAIGNWNRERQHIEVTVYGMNSTVSSTAEGAVLISNELGLVIRAGELSDGVREYPVNFADGVHVVALYDSYTWLYVAAVVTASLLLAVIVFLSTVLLYDQYMTRTVQTLSRQVRQVSQGDLQMRIRPMSQDEIGQLAMDVDNMRLSIIDKLRREEEAWQANTQLITAISHDVRTPLTALMGYLEVISDEALSPEDRKAYLEICKNNARRLKGLTDELFGFFLVFGKPTVDQSPELFDAAMLIEQIMMEHQLNLSQRGFQMELVHEGEISGNLKVDLTHLRRVFDNLISNVNKYADPEHPILVTIRQEEEELTVSMENHIAPRPVQVERNGIGLKTCHKLVTAMGGEFNQSRTDHTFRVEVLLPMLLSAEAAEI
ncbi:MAG: HAMP domain-containing histidine kinase [Oscillospiraceae bacterium]|nr:HAMP domain-containing histidine kinase [Oscillospiraceae bacterium]MBR2889911.1 HAMP domain-containing histidine kinase [Oscillospiraceae bacterium]